MGTPKKKLLSPEEIKAFLDGNQTKKNQFLEEKMCNVVSEVDEPLQQLKALETLGKFSNNSFLLMAKKPIDFYDEKIQLAFQVLLNTFYQSLDAGKLTEAQKQVVHSHLNRSLLGFEEKMAEMTKGIIGEATTKAVQLNTAKYIGESSLTSQESSNTPQTKHKKPNKRTRHKKRR